MMAYLTGFGICFIIDLGWLELTLMLIGVWLFLLNGWNLLFSKLNFTSRKFTIFKLEVISILTLVAWIP